MTSYTNIFNGDPIQPAYTSYASYTIPTPAPGVLVLNWASQFVNLPNVVAGWMDITTTNSLATDAVVMPTALDTSTGQKTTIRNISSFAFTVYANNGTTVIYTAAVSSVTDLILTNNTTQAGVWAITPHGGGYTAVTSVGIVAQNALGQVGGNLLITGSPITTSGMIAINLGSDLNALTQFSGTGFAYRTGSGTWSPYNIVGTAPVNVTQVGSNTTISISGVVTSVAASVPASPDSANLVITGSPIISSGAFNFAFTGDLGSLISYGSSTGIPIHTGTGTFALNSIVYGRFNGVSQPVGSNCSIISSFGVVDVFHSATGLYTVNFSTIFSVNTYTVDVTLGNGNAGFCSYNGPSTTLVSINTFNTSGTAIDFADISFVILQVA